MASLRINQYKSTQEIIEASTNLHSLLIEAKSHGEINQAVFTQLKKDTIDKLQPFINGAGQAHSEYERSTAEAKKYQELIGLLEQYMTKSGNGLESKRALFALIVGELANAYPNNVNYRALHTNLMAEQKGTHKPVYQISELGPLVDYALGGLLNLCEQHRDTNLAKAVNAQRAEEFYINKFNDSFPNLKASLTVEMTAIKEKRSQELIGEAKLVIQENIEDAKKHLKILTDDKDMSIYEMVSNSELPRDARQAIIQRLRQYEELLDAGNYNEAYQAAKSALNACSLARGAIGDSRTLVNMVRSSVNSFITTIEEADKFNKNQIGPQEIIARRVTEKSSALKSEADFHKDFFTRYADDNKNAKFSSYTASKGQLADKCSQFMKEIQEKIDLSQYQKPDDVAKDIQKLDSLRGEYATILQQGRQDAKLFTPKGTGEFATHINKKILVLREELESLQKALEHTSALKMK